MIINSLLDTDLYKFSQMQAVLHQFPNTNTSFKFKCRNEGVKFSLFQTSLIEKEIAHLCSLEFTEEELQYLKGIYFLKPDFIDFLRLFKLQTRYIDIGNKDGELKIKIDGPWLHTILFETAVLAIVNEVYFNSEIDKTRIAVETAMGNQKLLQKINLIRNCGTNFKFSDFGARRRFNFNWHEKVIETLSMNVPENFVGTSDVYFAKKFKTKPIGTMAHEWIQAGQALTRIRDSQQFMLQKWADEYRGALGIALSDTLGIDAFLRDFDAYFAKLFDGVRHDSGNPIDCGNKVIAHYEKLGIDPKTKAIVFSDSLDIPKANQLLQVFGDRIKVSFGIGTNLTNDLVRPPLNIVIKMTHCNGQPVAKISDNTGKGMCEDEGYLKYLKSVFNLEK